MAATGAQTSKTSARRRIPAGIFTVADAVAAGISRPTIYRLVSGGSVIQLDRGIFQNPATDIDPADFDFAIACAHFGPQSTIGGLTALFRYGLIEQVPSKTWILVPQHIKRRGARYRVIRTKLDPLIGISRHRYYRIANINRAIVEALRYSTKLGLSTAIHAARTAIKSHQTSEAKILKAARNLGLERFVLRQWDAIIVE